MRSKSYYRTRHNRRHPVDKVYTYNQVGVIAWGGGLNSEYWINDAKAHGLHVTLHKGYAAIYKRA